MQESVVRAMLGGIVVSSFALLGDVVRPKSFAGLFEVAPSVALATLALAVHKHGPAYGNIEARSMILSAIAFCLYASLTSRLMMHQKWPALAARALSLAVWLCTGVLGGTLKVEVDLGPLRRSTCYEYLVRFAFGGAVTVLAGVVANHYGPNIGGLFLAFPAIFSATATPLENTKNRQSQAICALAKWRELTRQDLQREVSAL